MLDLLIRGGSVVDGTGASRRRADVGVRDGRIVAIGPCDEPAARTLDADGLVVAPGFVDIHTHYDAQVLWDPALTPSSLHGVTTVVGGNCGFTVAPIEPSETDYVTRMLARVEGMPLESLVMSLTYDWRTFADYLDRIDGTLALNAGFLVGHCALRRVVMGDDAVGNAATPAHVDAMRRLLGESLAAGGLGFSSSRAVTHNDGEGSPVPSRWATTHEMVALSRVVRDHPGTTLQLIPSAGGAFDETELALMADMSIAADRPLNWNVLAPAAARADYAWDKLRSADYAAERGGCVLALTLPDVMRVHLTLKAGFVFDGLPGWARTMALPIDEKMRVLADPEARRRLREGAEAPGAADGLLPGVADWPRMTVVETYSTRNEGLAGRTIGDIAAERRQSPFDAMVDVSLADELRTVLLPRPEGDDSQSWELRRDVWRDPRSVVGASDAGAHLDMLAAFSFSTTMLEAARDRHLLPLEEAVHLVTDRPARLYGLRDRGRLAQGWHADLVVLDEERVRPGPLRWRNDVPGGAGRLYAEAEGIEHVFVNGREIVAGGELTGDRPGTVLRSGRDTDTVHAAAAIAAR